MSLDSVNKKSRRLFTSYSVFGLGPEIAPLMAAPHRCGWTGAAESLL